MTAYIAAYVSQCKVCQALGAQQQKETLTPHQIPSRPWSKIGLDIFTLSDQHYLIKVDYYSNFWETDRLDSMDSATVITKLESHYARYGIPSTVASDNGPQFASDKFIDFAKTYQFDHINSSPGYLQSNRKAESAVKTAKHIIGKAKNTGSDPWFSLLDHRNTPTA